MTLTIHTKKFTQCVCHVIIYHVPFVRHWNTENKLNLSNSGLSLPLRQQYIIDLALLYLIEQIYFYAAALVSKCQV